MTRSTGVGCGVAEPVLDVVVNGTSFFGSPAAPAYPRDSSHLSRVTLAGAGRLT